MKIVFGFPCACPIYYLFAAGGNPVACFVVSADTYGSLYKNSIQKFLLR